MSDAQSALHRVYHPTGSRMVSGVSGVVLTALLVFLWLMLPADAQAQFGWFQRATMLFFFACMLAVLYGVFRTRVEVLDRGVAVTNGYHRHELYWAEVVSISLTSARPWAQMDLSDGSTVAVMALQGADGRSALRATREIAELIVAQSQVERDD